MNEYVLVLRHLIKQKGKNEGKNENMGGVTEIFRQTKGRDLSWNGLLLLASPFQATHKTNYADKATKVSFTHVHLKSSADRRRFDDVHARSSPKQKSSVNDHPEL